MTEKEVTGLHRTRHLIHIFRPFTFRSRFPSSHFSVILSLLHLGLLPLLHSKSNCLPLTVFLLSSTSSQLLFVFWCSQRAALCSLPLLISAELDGSLLSHLALHLSLLKCTCAFNALSFAFMLDLFFAQTDISYLLFHSTHLSPLPFPLIISSSSSSLPLPPLCISNPHCVIPPVNID